MIEVSKFIANSNDPLSKALAAIDSNGFGVCFLVDKNGKVVGSLSDGDIRRALLKGVQVTDSCFDVMNTEFISLPAGVDNVTILNSLSDKIKAIPLVSQEGRVADIATRKNIRRIPVSAPSLSGNELAYVADCVESSWVSSSGKYVTEFQEVFRQYCGANHALAVSNGTVAIHLALEALGVGPGDEVIVPGLTFAASINAIIYTGATPVIADIDWQTLNLCPESTKRLITNRTKAIMPVHLYGYPCEMSAIVAVAEEHGLLIVEDCAEALGSTYKGSHVGAQAHAATFSFFGNKTITTGEGGMILFRDAETYEKAAVLRDHGMSKQKRYWHEYVGFNYRMTNMQAALGVAQMEQVDYFVNKKREIAKIYTEALGQFDFLSLPNDSEAQRNSYWLYTFIINKEVNTEKLIQTLLEKGVETRPIFYPLHVMPPYKKYRRDELVGIEQVANRGISLPSSTMLTEEETRFVAKMVAEEIAKLK